MLTKDDKKFIADTIGNAIAKNNTILIQRLDEDITKLDKKFEDRNDNLIKDVIGLFEATNLVIEKLDNKLSDKIDGVEKSLNEKIDKVNINLSEKIDDTNERIDKIFEHLRNDFDSIENLEKRTGKLEEKVFTISA